MNPEDDVLDIRVTEDGLVIRGTDADLAEFAEICREMGVPIVKPPDTK